MDCSIYDDVVVGARMWNGQYTDIPAMGYDPTDENTFGYCEKGDIPTFKLYKSCLLYTSPSPRD